MDSPQQFQDVKDKLEDLVPWVTKLKDSLTEDNAKDDREEERRAQLAKFVSRSVTNISSRWTDLLQVLGCHQEEGSSIVGKRDGGSGLRQGAGCFSGR